MEIRLKIRVWGGEVPQNPRARHQILISAKVRLVLLRHGQRRFGVPLTSIRLENTCKSRSRPARRGIALSFQASSGPLCSPCAAISHELTELASKLALDTNYPSTKRSKERSLGEGVIHGRGGGFIRGDRGAYFAVGRVRCQDSMGMATGVCS